MGGCRPLAARRVASWRLAFPLQGWERLLSSSPLTAHRDCQRTVMPGGSHEHLAVACCSPGKSLPPLLLKLGWEGGDGKGEKLNHIPDATTAEISTCQPLKTAGRRHPSSSPPDRVVRSRASAPSHPGAPAVQRPLGGK